MPSQTKSPQAELDKILAAAARKHGKGIVHKASESVPVYRLPFRQPQLNWATEGGPGFGRFMGMAGDPNSGKSRIAFELIAQAQQLPYSAEIMLIPRIAYHAALSEETSLIDPHRMRHLLKAERLEAELEWIRETFPHGCEAVYYNAEMQLDKVWAQKIGIDLDRLLIVESTTIEEIVELMEGLYPHYPLHVVDSTSNASSLLSQKQDVGKSLVGTDARQWKVCLRDSMVHWDRARNMAIMIHQLSANIRTGSQQMQATSYMRFISRLTLMFKHGKHLWSKNGVLLEDKPTGTDEQSMVGRAPSDGREVYAKVEKSTVCRPFREAGMQWHQNKACFVIEHELLSAALYFGIIGQKGGGYFYFVETGETIGQGAKTVYALFNEDPELTAQVFCRLLDFTAEM